jgi:hypothetical protein
MADPGWTGLNDALAMADVDREGVGGEVRPWSAWRMMAVQVGLSPESCTDRIRLETTGRCGPFPDAVGLILQGNVFRAETAVAEPAGERCPCV